MTDDACGNITFWQLLLQSVMNLRSATKVYSPVNESSLANNTKPDSDTGKTTVGQVIVQCAPFRSTLYGVLGGPLYITD